MTDPVDDLPDPQQKYLDRLTPVIAAFNLAAKADMFVHRKDPRLQTLPPMLELRRRAVYEKIDRDALEFNFHEHLIPETPDKEFGAPPAILHKTNYSTALFAVELAEIVAESLLRSHFKSISDAQAYLPADVRGNAEIADLFDTFSAPFMAQICRYTP